MVQNAEEAAARDPAEMAFEALKGEVATLRLAVQQLAAVPTQMEIPDYTETLAEILRATQTLANQYANLSVAPALSVTPEKLAMQINFACADVRKAERQSLRDAESSLINATSEIARFVESARTAEVQNKWVLIFGGLSFVTGGVSAWAIF